MWKKLSTRNDADVDRGPKARPDGRIPSLIKRPVLDTGKALLVGFDRKPTKLK